MKNFKQVITDANTEYIYSTDVTALDGALASLEEILGDPALNDNNRANADALRMRLACKIYALLCLTGLDAGILPKLQAFADDNLQSAVDKGYNKSAAVLRGSLSLVSALCGYIDEKRELTALCQSEYALINNWDNIIKRADGLIAGVRCLGFSDVFGENVAFAEVSERVISALSDWKGNLCGAYAKALERTVTVKPLEYRDYDYFPAPEYDEGGKANTLVISTPFMDEARLYAANAIPKDVAIFEFDISRSGGAAESIDNVFRYVECKNCALFISGTNSVSESNRAHFLRAAVAAGKAGAKVFIADSDMTLYAAAVSADEISALDISVTYITMPSFNDIVAELVSLKMAIEGEARAALREMPFLGFMGLNEIVRLEYSKSWKTRGKKISDKNAAAARAYLSKIKSSMLFIDGGWGDFDSGVGVAEHSGEFDYDGIPDIDLANIRRIAESGATVFGKCGMMARYCTTGTADMSVWSMLDRDEMEKRLTLAVKLVCRVLGVTVDPQVEIVDKLGGSAGGVCCDGGKLIKFKYSECKDLGWMRDAIVHECFHALQSKLTHGEWTAWYYDNMGISYGRVCLWKETMHHAYESDTKSDIYKVHMYEADARAFETDCNRGQAAYWGNIDFT